MFSLSKCLLPPKHFRLFPYYLEHHGYAHQQENTQQCLSLSCVATLAQVTACLLTYPQELMHSFAGRSTQAARLAAHLRGTVGETREVVVVDLPSLHFQEAKACCGGPSVCKAKNS